MIFLLTVALAYAGTACLFLAVVWLHTRHRGCRRGVVMVGQAVKFKEATRFDVSIHGVSYPTGGDSGERRLSLMVTSDGVAVEVDIEDGMELLRELYDGRAWLTQLEGAAG